MCHMDLCHQSISAAHDPTWAASLRRQTLYSCRNSVVANRLSGRATWALSRGKIVARVEGHGFDISVHSGWDMMGPLCLQSKSG